MTTSTTNTPTPALPSNVEELRELWTITPCRGGFNIHEGKQLVGWFADRALAQQIVDENNGTLSRASTPTEKEATPLTVERSDGTLTLTVEGSRVMDRALRASVKFLYELPEEDRSRSASVTGRLDKALANFLAVERAEDESFWPLYREVRDAYDEMKRDGSASVTDALSIRPGPQTIRPAAPHAAQAAPMSGQMGIATSTLPARDVLNSVRLRLREHYLTGIHCDHERKTDRASCSCSIWRGEEKPSIDAAVQDWIEHALPIFAPTPPAHGERELHELFQNVLVERHDEGAAEIYWTALRPHWGDIYEAMRRVSALSPSPPQQDGSGLVEADRKAELKVLRKAKVLSMIWTSKGEVDDPDVLVAISDVHDAICALYGVDPKIGFALASTPKAGGDAE